MATAYTDVVFTTQQPDQPTAMKLNKLTRDLSAAIAAGGGGTGTGDMTKAVYDTDNNGKVDTCDSVPWGSVTGKPSVIGDMTKAVYDTNGDGISDHAALSDTAPWTGITGKPASFVPSAHASTHLAAGSDPIALATSVLAGLCPAVDNTTIQIVTSKLSCVALAWTAITGKPATFPPDSTAELVARKGAVNGYAGLDASGKVPVAQLPPFGTGDMTKAVYDTNNDSIVDHAALADAAPWTGISGKPSTFPPDSTAMLKSVYDINGDGISDRAATADSVPWTGVSGKPAAFPPDSTAMLKSVYDTNADNVVDHAALADTATNANAVPWSGVTGKPSTFPPDSTAMLKSVYDTNANNKVDSAESADSVPWTGVTAKPATFPPTAHGSTHLDNGTDVVPVVTTTRTGLVPQLSGDSSTFLNGVGGYTAPAGGGDMLKSVYDTGNNGVVDTCDSLAWGKLTSVPSSFNPSAHASTHTPSGPDPIAFSAGFISKIGTYTLVPQDSNKYIICSLGSWTLYLPAAAAGLTYFVRNDQGIAIGSTTGTITVSPSSGTIDGKASVALLPQQECRIFCDGTNWRTFGLQREVVLGTQDITSSTPNGSFLLPVGFRYFELVFSALTPVTSLDQLRGQLSNDGGASWLGGAYINGLFYPNSATTVAYQSTNDTFIRISAQNTSTGLARVLLYPGSLGHYPAWICDNCGYNTSLAIIGAWRCQGLYNANAGTVNALQYSMSSSNISNLSLTVKGFV
jgi:hypothetical protein